MANRPVQTTATPISILGADGHFVTDTDVKNVRSILDQQASQPQKSFNHSLQSDESVQFSPTVTQTDHTNDHLLLASGMENTGKSSQFSFAVDKASSSSLQRYVSSTNEVSNANPTVEKGLTVKSPDARRQSISEKVIERIRKLSNAATENFRQRKLTWSSGVDDDEARRIKEKKMQDMPFLRTVDYALDHGAAREDTAQPVRLLKNKPKKKKAQNEPLSSETSVNVQDLVSMPSGSMIRYGHGPPTHSVKGGYANLRSGPSYAKSIASKNSSHGTLKYSDSSFSDSSLEFSATGCLNCLFSRHKKSDQHSSFHHKTKSLQGSSSSLKMGSTPGTRNSNLNRSNSNSSTRMMEGLVMVRSQGLKRKPSYEAQTLS